MPSFMCGTCARWFDSYHSREQHMDAVGHDVPYDEYDFNYDCRACGDAFQYEHERNDHEVDECHYCVPCNRAFMNANNLKMHLNSRIHRGANMTCPFCKSAFATATGVCHHLENGGCSVASGLTRDDVYKVVRSKDPSGIISKKLIGWHGSTTYEANDNSWNGRGFECYLCHKTYTGIRGLNQHLSSPAHQQNLYHCPNRGGCGKDFKSLAAVMNHLESESCGYTRFQTVQKGVQTVFAPGRLISF